MSSPKIIDDYIMLSNKLTELEERLDDKDCCYEEASYIMYQINEIEEQMKELIEMMMDTIVKIHRSLNDFVKEYKEPEPWKKN